MKKVIKSITWQSAVLWAVLLLLSLGQLQRLQLDSGIAVYAYDVVIILSLLVGIATQFKTWKESLRTLRHTPWFVPGLLLGGWIVIGLVNAVVSGTPTLTAILRLTRLGMYAAWAWQVSLWIQTKKTTISKLVWGVLTMAGLVAVWGFLQYLILPDTRYLATLGWDNHYFRLISTWLDPGFTGLLLVLGILWTWRWRQKMSFTINTGLIIFLSITTALTYSRSSLVAWLAAVGLLLGWKSIWKKKPLTVWLPLLLSLGILLSSWWWLPRKASEGTILTRTSTIDARVVSTQSVLENMTVSEWIKGRGLLTPIKDSVARQEAFATYNHAVIPDNLVTQLLSGIGIGGVALLLWLCWEVSRRHRTSLWLGSVFLAVLLHSLFNNSLFHPFISLSLFLSIVAEAHSRPKGDTK
jgi:hypothetical protein